jgi:hypothetical protein
LLRASREIITFAIEALWVSKSPRNAYAAPVRRSRIETPSRSVLRA